MNGGEEVTVSARYKVEVMRMVGAAWCAHMCVSCTKDTGMKASKFMVLQTLCLSFFLVNQFFVLYTQTGRYNDIWGFSSATKCTLKSLNFNTSWLNFIGLLKQKNNIMLTKTRIPAKITFNMDHLWLAVCLILLSRNLLSTIICLSCSMTLGPHVNLRLKLTSQSVFSNLHRHPNPLCIDLQMILQGT